MRALALLFFALAAIVSIAVFVAGDAQGSCNQASCMGAPCSRTLSCASPRCGCAIREGQPYGRCVSF